MKATRPAASMRSVALSLLAAAVCSAAQGSAAQGSAAQAGPATAPPDTIYVGQIITMDAAAPEAEALAVRGEGIVAVGRRAELLKSGDRHTRIVELGNRALLPGFIDAHSHLTATAAFIQFANLASPPVGAVHSIAELQDTLRAFIHDRHVAAGQWVVGVGYDDSLLAEHRHPTRADLDAVSGAHKILVVHVSGHFSAANSLLLAASGINSGSADPPGGIIRRQDNSREPDGVLEESAHMALFATLPRADLAQALANVMTALEYYASMGITTVQDGAASRDNLALLTEAARQHLLHLDVVAYRFWSPDGAAFPEDLPYGSYVDRFKLGGVKLILDGAPQGKTAFLSQPYHVPPAGKPADYRGYPALPAASVTRAVHEAMQRNVPLLAHANGDAAAQMLIDAVAIARRETGNALCRVVMIHAQTVRDDQLDRMRELNITPSFFVGHTFYWGDWHREETLGLPRAERISPTRSAIERGLPLTLHTDSPVVPPDIIRTLWSATTRRTRSNDILGPAQRLTVLEALQGVTVNAAEQYSEQDRKGSLAAGKLADLVILSRNPLLVDPEHLLEIEVEETVSHGKTVYLKQ